MTVYAYCRCSTDESRQNIQRQVSQLKEAGADRIYQEFIHGDSASKPQLELLLDTVKEGDTIMVHEVSRLARSTQQFLKIIEQIKEKKICLKILNSITVDCRDGNIDPTCQAFLAVISVVSELELNIIRERVRSGMQNAKVKGKRLGRPCLTTEDISPLFYKHYPAFANGTMNVSELARVCNLSRNTVYKSLSLLEEKNDSAKQ